MRGKRSRTSSAAPSTPARVGRNMPTPRRSFTTCCKNRSSRNVIGSLRTIFTSAAFAGSNADVSSAAAESVPRSSELPDLATVLLLEQRWDVQTECDLDRLARSACGCIHDQPARRRLGGDERRVIWREVSVGYDALHSHGKSAYIA